MFALDPAFGFGADLVGDAYEQVNHTVNDEAAINKMRSCWFISTSALGRAMIVPALQQLHVGAIEQIGWYAES